MFLITVVVFDKIETLKIKMWIIIIKLNLSKGYSQFDKVTDDMPHTTLMFTNGPGFNFSWDGEKVRNGNCL